MSLIEIINNLKAVPDFKAGEVRPPYYMFLEEGIYAPDEIVGFAPDEIVSLQNELNRLQITHAVLQWRTPVSVEKFKSYFLDIFEQTAIRHVTLSIPNDLALAHLQVLREGIRAIRAYDAAKQIECTAIKKGWIYPSFTIQLQKGLNLGVPGAQIFDQLLCDLELSNLGIKKLPTKTIAMPTRFYFVPGGYSIRDLKKDFNTLMHSGKFNKFSLVWNEGAELSPAILSHLLNFFEAFHTIKGSVKHYEIDASRVRLSSHIRLIQSHVDLIQSELAKIGDPTVVSVRGALGAYHSRLFVLKPSRTTNIKKKAPYRVRKAKARAKASMESYENTDMHRLFKSIHADNLPTSKDVNDILFTMAEEERQPDQSERERRGRATTL